MELTTLTTLDGMDSRDIKDLTTLGFLYRNLCACKTFEEVELFLISIRCESIPSEDKRALIKDALWKQMRFAEEFYDDARSAKQKTHTLYGVVFSNGLLKIGKSLSFDGRMKQLASCNAENIIAKVHAQVSDCNKAESSAHSFFREHRKHGEYFSITLDQFTGYLNAMNIPYTRSDC